MNKNILKAGVAAGVLILTAPFCAAAADSAATTGSSAQETRQEMKEARKDMKEMNGKLKDSGSPETKEMKAEEAAKAVQEKRDEATMERLERKEDKQSVGEYIDDAAVTTKVKSAFLAQKGLESLDIKVVTVDGEVTLMGDVATEAQVELAGTVAKDVKGVRKVTNQLAVKK